MAIRKTSKKTGKTGKKDASEQAPKKKAASKKTAKKAPAATKAAQTRTKQKTTKKQLPKKKVTKKKVTKKKATRKKALAKAVAATTAGVQEAAASGPTLKLQYYRSAIGLDKKQKSVVRGLGFRRLNAIRELVDTPAIRGMVAKIPHLVRIVGA